jgi:hypothetical protein
MKCPQCAHEDNQKNVQCARCRREYRWVDLEEWQHWEFLSDWLTEQEGVLDETTRTLMLAEAATKRDLLLKKLVPPRPTPKPRPKPEPAPQPVAIAIGEAKAAAAAPIANPPKPQKMPVAPAKPARQTRQRPSVQMPHVNWSHVWDGVVEAAVSGALLRGILYLGAFMIVVSLTILVVRFWDRFPSLLQLGFIAAVPTGFYLCGWAIRRFWQLPMAGEVLSGVGALLVALDFVAVYQLGGLAGEVSPLAYWLLASVVCTAVYAATVWALPGEFFAYLLWLGGVSVGMSLTAVAGAAPGWWMMVGALLTVLILVVGQRWQPTERWAALPVAACRLPMLLLPLAQLLVLFTGQIISFASLITWLIVAVGYALLARQYRVLWLTYASLLTLTLPLLLLPAHGWQMVELLPLTAVVLAPIYIILSELLLPWLPKWQRPVAVLWRGTGLLLLLGGVAGAVPLFWSYFWLGVGTETVAVLALLLLMLFTHKNLYGMAALFLFVAPYSLGVGHWLNDVQPTTGPSWLLLALVGLAYAYLSLAILLNEPYAQVREKTVVWFTSFTICSVGISFLLLLGVLMGLLSLLLEGGLPMSLLDVATLTAVTAFWLVAVVLYDRQQDVALGFYVKLSKSEELYHWPLALLLPFCLIGVWPYTFFSARWLGLTLLALSWLYVAVGYGLRRRRNADGWPWHTAVYMLLLLGVGLTLVRVDGTHWQDILLTACLMLLPPLAALALIYRRSVEAWLLVPLHLIAILLLFAWLNPDYMMALPLMYAISALMGLALVVWLQRGVDDWRRLFVWPTRLFVALSWGLGLLLVSLPSYEILDGGWPADDEWRLLLLTLATAVVTVVWAAFLSRRRWLLAVEPWLVLWLAAVALAAPLDGLWPHEFAVICLVVGGLHGATAVWLDNRTPKMADGLYVGGYAMLGLALLYSWFTNEFMLVVWGVVIALLLLSQAVVHGGWMPAFDRFVGRLGDNRESAVGLLRASFLLAAALLLPLWLARLLAALYVPVGWQAVGLALLAWGYVLLARFWARRYWAYAWVLWGVGYGLTAVTVLAVFGQNNVWLQAGTLTILAGLYYASGVWYGQARWLYVANVLPPVIGLLLLDARGVWTETRAAVVLLSVALVYVGVGRWLDDWRRPLLETSRFALPFYLFGYPLSTAPLLVGVAAWDGAFLLQAGVAGLALYAISAWAFRAPVFLYAALFSAHMAVVGALLIDPPDAPDYMMSGPFHVMTWCMWLGAVLMSRFQSKEVQAKTASRRELLADSTLLAELSHLGWVQPFLVFGLLDLLLWMGVAAAGPLVGVLVALGSALLLALVAQWWRDGLLPYGSLLFVLAALLRQGVTLDWPWYGLVLAAAVWGLLAYGVYLLLTAVDRGTLWQKPLFQYAMVVTTGAMAVNLTAVRESPEATAMTLTVGGLLYLVLALRQKQFALGYLGAGLVQAGWLVLLVTRGVTQPQFYALPVGLYLVGVGVMEQRRERPFYANYLEGLGLSILLITTFIQSMNGLAGFGYFLLLLVESVVVMLWGGLRKEKTPFFIGLAAAVLNVVAQVLLLVSVLDINRWVAVLTTGVLLMITAVLVERKREEIREHTKIWRETLASWH